MKFFRTDQKKEFFTSEKCFITEILNNSDHPNISFAQARVEPGVETQLHSLTDTIEYYYITQGRGTMSISGESQDVVSGDCVSIQPGEKQKIRNTGMEDLIFLCICLPRFRQEMYKVEE